MERIGMLGLLLATLAACSPAKPDPKVCDAAVREFNQAFAKLSRACSADDDCVIADVAWVNCGYTLAFAKADAAQRELVLALREKARAACRFVDPPCDRRPVVGRCVDGGCTPVEAGSSQSSEGVDAGAAPAKRE